jgi:hypothetical protein
MKQIQTQRNKEHKGSNLFLLKKGKKGHKMIKNL